MPAFSLSAPAYPRSSGPAVAAGFSSSRERNWAGGLRWMLSNRRRTRYDQ